LQLIKDREKTQTAQTPKTKKLNNTIMKTNEELNEMYDEMIERGVCTFKEIELVTSINGYNEGALNDIVYVRTGYVTLDQYIEYENSQS
jgi:MoaA/NifB/PqqE/SkfB family radical SAM enzyme